MAWADQAKELYFERGIDNVAGGKRRRRGWRVAGVAPDIADQLAGVPQRGDIENFDGVPLRLDSMSFNPDGAGTLAIGVYTPLTYGTLDPPENRNDVNFVDGDTSFEDEDEDIPLYQVRVVTGLNNGTPFFLTTYQAINERRKFRRTITMERITVNAEVAASSTGDAQLAFSSIIGAQNNKIHQINGKKYRFKCESSKRTSPTTFRFVYRWYQDPGIPNTLNYDSLITPNLGRIGTKVYAFANSEFIFKPFEGLDVAAADEGDPTTPPLVVSSPLYVEDLTGWQTLPGMS